MNLSFFARKPFLKRGGCHLVGGSSIIRAEQIAEFLGVKYNPVSGYENDVHIYVKPDADSIPYGGSNKIYLDIIDYWTYVRWLCEHPEWFGIVSSQYSYDILKDRFPGRIVFIPQQHCNFECFARKRNEIAVVGILGRPVAFQYPVDEVRKKLEQIGLRLIVNFDFRTREDVVNFYKNIDIQIIWYTNKKDFLKTPLKIINAASFGIPTVGCPHRGYKEAEGYYIRAQTIDQLVSEVEKLKNPENYIMASKNLLQMAEKYHISKIAELYKQLL